jgi:Family of unknown function (DUF6116)
MRTPWGMIRNRLIAFASRLRFPNLLALTVALFLIDLIVPDIVPFADEILLGLIAAILASIKRK